uniref:NitT/TauT family transport system ATP-binding protein n=1 Tax=Candidatus Kentrum sp. DK TaxID=2126562 RepID=A0A450SRH0_9GAMM|nr:MAG: NitT/TauT family transport system ATP-binding protein [Candidatus Kentron sp. DK]
MGLLTMTEHMLELHDIYLSFRGNAGDYVRVLDGISLDVVKGQFLTILGPSGCGKSTLLRLMAGLLTPDQGSIHWQDDLLEARPLHMSMNFPRSSRMAMNFQRPVLLPWLSIENNALLPFRLLPHSDPDPSRTKRQARLAELLDLTGLARFRHSLPHELSGGMQMRAALIRTLITEPSLIFMDEPFSAIDELTRQELGKEFRAITRTGNVSTVFVTHSIQEAAFLSDRVIVLSPRPSHIVDDTGIHYSYPERADILRRKTEFLDICDHLREVMAHG